MAKEFKKLLNFLKNPIKFFEENEENTDSLLDFMVFVSRAYVIIYVIIGTIIERKSISSMVIIFLIVFLLAKIFATITLFFSGKLFNFFAIIFGGQSNELAAARVIAYTWSVSFLYLIPAIGTFSFIITTIFYMIGFSKQYRISFFRSFMVAVLPLGILEIIRYFFI